MTAHSKRILVVDDDKFQRDSMKKMLVRLGYDVELARNANEALEISQQEVFPLIITDLKMPEMDGTQLCERIRKINGTAVIYAFSGYLSEIASDQLNEVGFDGHLCKPVRLEVLKHAVEGAFDKIDQRQGSVDKTPK
jgi:CheY-like chemotaxis protein